MNEVDGKYILTKYMPSFDWYLVIQRDTGNMQSTFSNVVFYMSAGFLVALIALLAFVQIFLKRGMNSRHAINQEFLSKNYGWCKAYFMVADLNQIVFAVELIDEEKRREKHLVYLSETDAMTGLKNRGSGEKAIADLIAEGTEGMFCLLDADKFKSILGDRKISISLGAAIFSASEDVTFTELYKRADAVAYESKKTVGNCATFYKSSDNL